MKELSYDEVMEIYFKNNIKDCKFRNVEEIKKILGFDFKKIKGYENLSTQEKIQSENLICNYINGWGLKARMEQIPVSIIIDNKRRCYKVVFKNKKFSYLFFDGTIG